MCVCACVRGAALAALAPVMPRTKRHSGVRSESEACRMARRTLVRCGCDAGEPVSACMCACVYGADRLAQRWWVVLPTTSVPVPIFHKSQCLQRFPGSIFGTTTRNTVPKSTYCCSKGH
jgi:hypothetical protein